MARFVVLYRALITAAEQLQQEAADGTADVQSWVAWADRTGTALVDQGTALGTAVAISTTGIGASPSTIAGYCILEAPDLDRATKLVVDHPHLRIGTLELYEALAAPGA